MPFSVQPQAQDLQLHFDSVHELYSHLQQAAVAFVGSVTFDQLSRADRAAWLLKHHQLIAFCCQSLNSSTSQ
ncbi:MAG: hypothetical protein EOP50_00480 [Sphingobacteriales bacterium]|nr:MAG: hypothetical protein EOP50_00480 [Sphingobacteriales bacterium]